MGSGVITFLLSPLMFILSVFLIKKYRQLVVEKFKQTAFWKAVEATKFYQWYYKYDSYKWD